MKKEKKEVYEAPKIEFIEFELEEGIAVSGGDGGVIGDSEYFGGF
jgi:hypothetical protein